LTARRVEPEHPRACAPSRRLRPDDERAGDEERPLRMSSVGDHVAHLREVVDVDVSDPAATRALGPGGDPVADVWLSPRRDPERAVGGALRRTDLRDRAGARVPRPGREVVEVLERVVLVPDEPAAVEGTVRLVRPRVGEAADTRDATGRDVDARDAGPAAALIDRREERPPVVGQ